MKRVIAGLALALPLLVGCSLGEGTGEVKAPIKSKENPDATGLFAHDCWGKQIDATHAEGAVYDMQPDFFAAVPYRNTLQIRVQHGTDFAEVSDGLDVLIDDIAKVRAGIAKAAAQAADAGADGGDAGTGGADGGDGGAGDPDGGTPAKGPATFRISVPAGVVPPGSPTVPPPDIVADPPIIHVALYLQRSCHNQNTVLYGVDGTMTFTHLFDGDPNETSAAEKLTDATFEIEVGDLRDVPFGEYVGNVPAGLRSRIYGQFRFYFERGQPGQPFP